MIEGKNGSREIIYLEAITEVHTRDSGSLFKRKMER